MMMKVMRMLKRRILTRGDKDDSNEDETVRIVMRPVRKINSEDDYENTYLP